LVSATTSAAQGALQSLGQSVHRLSGQVEDASREHARLGGEVARLRASGRVPEDLAKRYDRLGKSIESAKLNLEGLTRAQKKAASHRAAMGEMRGQAVGVAALGATLAAPIRSAMAFESAMADVRKVVDGSEADLNGLGNSIKQLSRRIPLSAVELAQLAASGGQLGVALKDLPGFIETTAKMAVAFDMSADAAGDSMAKVANVYQIPIGSIGHLGDVVNQLSNESPAKARDIVDSLTRVGGVARQFGLSADSAAALSSALISLGKPPQVAGMAINGMLTKLATADKQGAKFQEALAAMGMSAEGLKKAIATDAQGALLGFLKALEKVPNSERTGLLVDMMGLEYADDVALLAGSVGTYTDALGVLSRVEGSMENEFAARAGTTENELQLLKNAVSELSTNLGTALFPALKGTFSTLRPLVVAMAEWATANPELVSAIGKAAAVLLAFKAASLGARAGYHLLGGSLWSSIARWRSIKASVQGAMMAMQAGNVGKFAAVTGRLSAASGWLASHMGSIASLGGPLKVPHIRLAAIAASAKASGAALSGSFSAGLLSARQGALRFGSSLRPLPAIAGRGLVSGLKSSAQAVLWLGRAMLLSPIGWIGIAIAGAALLIWKFWKPIKGFFVGMFQGLSSALKPVGDAMRTAFAPVAWIVKPVADALGQVWAWVKALLQPVEDTGGAAQSLGQKFGTAIGTIIRLVIGLPLRLAMLPLEFIKLGAQIIGGLLGGLKQGWESLKSGLSELAGNVVGSFKSLLGIRSPSRVFAGLGGMLGAGLAVGMKGSAGEVARAAGEMSKAATPNLPTVPLQALAGRNAGGGAGAAAGAGRGGMNVTFAPVIHVGQGGGGVREQVKEAMSLSFAEFERLMSRYERDHARRSPA
jgi:TP901 family phage tail tape measure protein